MHLGQLAVGDGYDRTTSVQLPDGINGPYYIIVQTGSGIFEFIYTDNNTGSTTAIPVELSALPDPRRSKRSRYQVQYTGRLVDRHLVERDQSG